MLENAQLKKKLHKIKTENTSLKEQLSQITERRKIEELMRQYVTTHNMETQTDPPKSAVPRMQQQRKKDPDQCLDNEGKNKLIAMHNSLMRRYERELKVSMQHVETITELQLKVNSLEQKLKEAEMRVQEEASKRRYTRQRPNRRRDGFDSSSDEDDKICRLKEEIKRLKKDKDKLGIENKKIKAELKGLDLGFFEEIEDLKFSLQQSLDLNQRYERSLRRVCAKFGLPYPHPEKHVE